MMEASTIHSWVRVFIPVVLPAWNNFPWIVLWIPPPHHSLYVLSCFSRVWLCATPRTVACQAPLSIGFLRQYWSGKVVLRWRKNRTGIPLSPQQILQKNIWTLSKFHKTTFECWQKTSDSQKSSPLSSKGGRKNIKEKKRGKRGRDGAPSWEGSLKKERFPDTRRHSHCRVCGKPWNHRRQQNWDEKINK